ncbi:MAG: glycolate oxidase FAD binding subunit [Oceanicoccus sp.]|jgi:glycolate oxidase FAD binding subunit
MSDVSSELINRVAAAIADQSKLNVVGRATKNFIGRNPTGEVVSLAEHSGIISYQPVELVMTVRAGTTLMEIENTLQEHGQMMSFEPPNFDGQATIGGTLACNMSGPARPWSGSVRDMVLGVKLINGKAEHLNFGGQVMKNVAGYDVSRLQAGAMGTLGILTEISFKVMPKLAMSATLVKEMDAQEAIETIARLSGKANSLTGACWLDGKLTVRMSGAARAVEAAIKQWPGGVLDDADSFWHKLREQQLDFFAGDLPLWRFSVNSNASHFLPDENWLIDWGGAQRWLRGNFEKEILEQQAVKSSGQVGLYRGGNRNGEVFHSQSNGLKTIHQRLKFSMDPSGIFNPGRLYEWL